MLVAGQSTRLTGEQEVGFNGVWVVGLTCALTGLGSWREPMLTFSLLGQRVQAGAVPRFAIYTVLSAG